MMKIFVITFKLQSRKREIINEKSWQDIIRYLQNAKLLDKVFSIEFAGDI